MSDLSEGVKGAIETARRSLIAWPSQPIEPILTDLARAAQAEERAEHCTCGGALAADGPSPDCPEHGKQPSDYERELAEERERARRKDEAQRDLIGRLTGKLAEVTGDLQAERERREKAEIARDEWAERYEAILGKHIDTGWIHGWEFVRAAEARVEKLEEALRKIAGDETGMGVHRPCCARGQSIARAALSLPKGVLPEQEVKG